MGWFSKKEEVPELPDSPILPEFPKSDEEKKKELPELPSFPSDSKNENFNQEMVKSAVGDNTSLGENEVHVEIPKNLHIEEVNKGESLIPPKPSREHIAPEPSLEIKESAIPKLPKREPIKHLGHKATDDPTEPIFVRIDKFQSAQKNFEHIKNKIGNIESTLKKIKEIKIKEEEEINGWSKEVELLKSKLSEIDSDIFDKI